MWEKPADGMTVFPSSWNHPQTEISGDVAPSPDAGADPVRESVLAEDWPTVPG